MEFQISLNIRSPLFWLAVYGILLPVFGTIFSYWYRSDKNYSNIPGKALKEWVTFTVLWPAVLLLLIAGGMGWVTEKVFKYIVKFFCRLTNWLNGRE